MTQLYSNLVTYMNNTTYLCLVLAALCSPVISKVRLVSLHTAHDCIISPHLLFLLAWQAFPLLLITEDKGGLTHGHKTKSQFCLTEAGTSCFTIFGKDVSG